MPCTFGGWPVAIDMLLGLVKDGITECAIRSVPSARMRSRLGISPSAMATSRYSGSQPSRQMTTAQVLGAAYCRPLASTGVDIDMRYFLQEGAEVDESLWRSSRASGGGAALATPMVFRALAAASTTSAMTW